MWLQRRALHHFTGVGKEGWEWGDPRPEPSLREGWPHWLGRRYSRVAKISSAGDLFFFEVPTFAWCPIIGVLTLPFQGTFLLLCPVKKVK